MKTDDTVHSPSRRAILKRGAGGRLGTFAGVFTPSVLTILGIILFLRMGYVVGAAGLPRALLIIALANAISILTSISLATIATNLKVKGGGDYYLISRTLGVEFGGSLGLVLFLAQSVSIAFYAIGFGEAVAAILGDGRAWMPQAIALGAVTGLFVLAWLGADIATRFQFAVMAVLFAAIAGFFWSGVGSWRLERMLENTGPAGDLPFWGIFAIFFPAVTGFTQGVSMSGDLKDPGKSLPRGTFWAVGLSALVYVGTAVVFAGTLPGSELVSDYGAMRRVSAFAWLVDAGVIAATLSSALASYLGAPRILQSLARDRVFKRLDPFAAGHGPQANPRRGVLLATAIALATIALGDLDLIAPVVSMFFLISYGLLNYATYYEARAKSPSFRPTFRWHHQSISLAGAIACLAVMLAIHPAAAIIAVAILFGIHQYLRRTVTDERWSDSSRSHRYQLVRENLIALSAEEEHPRDWRPVLLALYSSLERREELLRFAKWIEGNSGFTTAVQFVREEGPAAPRLRREMEKRLLAELEESHPKVFGLVVTGKDAPDCFSTVVQAHGLGPIRANSLLLNWFDQSFESRGRRGFTHYEEIIRRALRHRCNLIVLEATPEELAEAENLEPEERCIDVYFADDRTGQLSLLLAYLMTRDETWEAARLRVLAPARGRDGSSPDLESLEKMLADFRIDAEAEIIPQLDEKTILERSAGSTMVYLPFRFCEANPDCVFEGSLDVLVDKLRITALVLAAQDVDLDAEPEAGAAEAEAADAGAPGAAPGAAEPAPAE